MLYLNLLTIVLAAFVQFYIDRMDLHSALVVIQIIATFILYKNAGNEQETEIVTLVFGIDDVLVETRTGKSYTTTKYKVAYNETDKRSYIYIEQRYDGRPR